MPPWNDVTLHDMVARTILRGGVLYRDVFDTNLPGIDWSMAAIRYLFGWSYEVLRAVDLVGRAGRTVMRSIALLCPVSPVRGRAMRGGVQSGNISGCAIARGAQ